MSPKIILSIISKSQAGEEGRTQLLLHLLISQLGRPFFGHDDNVRLGQAFLVAPEKFPKQALDPVAADRRAYLPSHHQSQARADTFPQGQTNPEMGRVEFSAPGLSLNKVLTA